MAISFCKAAFYSSLHGYNKNIQGISELPYISIRMYGLNVLANVLHRNTVRPYFDAIANSERNYEGRVL